MEEADTSAAPSHDRYQLSTLHIGCGGHWVVKDHMNVPSRHIGQPGPDPLYCTPIISTFRDRFNCSINTCCGVPRPGYA